MSDVDPIDYCTSTLEKFGKKLGKYSEVTDGKTISYWS